MRDFALCSAAALFLLAATGAPAYAADKCFAGSYLMTESDGNTRLWTLTGAKRSGGQFVGSTSLSHAGALNISNQHGEWDEDNGDAVILAVDFTFGPGFGGPTAISRTDAVLSDESGDCAQVSATLTVQPYPSGTVFFSATLTGERIDLP